MSTSDGMSEVGWLADYSVASLRSALASVAPELAELPLRVNPRHPQSNPFYWSASAVIDGRFVVKYAWSEVRALRLYREGVLLERLREAAPSLALPDVVALDCRPALLVTTLAEGEPLSWEWANSMGPSQTRDVGDQLADYLVQLHGLPHVRLVGDLPVVDPTPQADTQRLRSDFPRIVDERRAAAVLDWCDWVDEVLAAGAGDAGAALVHGDLHGHNQVWDATSSTLRAVVDYEESGITEPNFDLRYLPGSAKSLDLVLAVLAAYERRSSARLQIERIMAWHVLTVLGDALWRTEAGVALPLGGGSAATWVDDLARRLVALDLA